MNTATGALSALRRLTIAIAIAIVFVFGLASTVFLSLRSPEVKVPDVIGKDRFEAERVLGEAGLNFRVRASRPSNEVSANTVLFQLPRGGEVVKAGQTVAMDISRGVKEGEASEAVSVPEKSPEEKPASEAGSENENKPRRSRNTNANANSNTGNRNANANRPANTNRNINGNVNRPVNANSTRPPLTNNNSIRVGNQNGSARPPAAKPAPTRSPR
ncbi:MAG TPA: PASTA domain-containing protein [Pyrinomonadaceae bacterium]|nr:PASTA domain-containing protein [Pyrinomonadaceae bacterium]